MPVLVEHGDLRAGAASGIHPVHDYDVTSEAARLDLVLPADGAGKVCRQVVGSDVSYWIVMTVTAGVGTWSRLDNTGGVTLSATPPPNVAAASAAGIASTASSSDHTHGHGDQAGGTLHANVVAGGAAGFMSGTDKTKLDSVATGATVGPAAPSGAPPDIAAAGAQGTNGTYATANHTHGHGNQAGGALHANAVAAGAAGFMTGADKTKLDGIATGATVGPTLASTAPANVTKAAAAVGVGTTVARADHKHDVTTAAPVAIAQANAEGSATSLARSDHAHDHGAQPLGTGNQHAIATTTVAGFLSAADKVLVDTISSKGVAGFTSVQSFTVASRNVVLADNGSLLLAEGTGEQWVMLQLDATLNLPVGFAVTIARGLTPSVVGFGWAVGITTLYDSTNYNPECLGIGSVLTAIKIGANRWLITGDMAAAGGD